MLATTGWCGPVLVVLLLSASSGCEDPCAAPGPADACHAVDPGLPGMFPVGVTTVELVDPKRTDLSGATRRLTVEIWYPAVPEAAGAPRDVYDLFSNLPPDLALGNEDLEVPTMKQDAARDVALDHRFAPYPILVFSHGKGGIRFQTFSLMIHLASHGFVVAAPDHTDDTIWDLMRRRGDEGGATIQSLVDRPKDAAFVAEMISSSHGPLGAVVDMSRWGVFGHSFGGAVSVAIAAEDSEFFDERVGAILPIAPAVRIVDILGAGTDRGIAPMMILGGLDDGTTDFENEQVFGYEAGNEPKALVGVRGAGHFSFTEMCPLELGVVAQRFGLDVGNLLNDGCGPESIKQADMHRVQNYFAAAFFNRYLRGSGAAALRLDSNRIPADIALMVEYRQSGIAP